MFILPDLPLDVVLFLGTFLSVASLVSLSSVSVEFHRMISVYSNQSNVLLWDVGRLPRSSITSLSLVYRYTKTSTLIIEGSRRPRDFLLPLIQHVSIRDVIQMKELYELHLSQIFFLTVLCRIGSNTLKILKICDSVSDSPDVYYSLSSMFPKLTLLQLSGRATIRQFGKYFYTADVDDFASLQRLVLIGSGRYLFLFEGRLDSLRILELRNVHWHTRYQLKLQHVAMGEELYEDITEKTRRVFPSATLIHDLPTYDRNKIIGGFNW